jgi:Xaa-Pro dipeptidase
METVPKAEIEQRIRRFQAELAAIDLEGAFILQNADIFYFTGTIQSSVLFVPSQGQPVLMVQKNLQRARHESSLNEIVPIKNKNQIPGMLNDFKFDRLRRAGLEMDVLPTNLYLWFQKAISRCRWLDVSDCIRKLRMIKSAYEV